MPNKHMVPIGRVIIALRICARVEAAINAIGEVDNEDELINKFIDALNSPYRPKNRKILEPLLRDINGADKEYYPSKETFDLSAIIADKFAVIGINDY